MRHFICTQFCAPTTQLLSSLGVRRADDAIYIYKADLTFDLDGFELKLPSKVDPAGECDIIR